MGDIRIDEVITFVITLATLIGSIGVIIKAATRPMSKIQSKLDDLQNKVEKLDDRVSELKDDVNGRLASIEKKQHKQARDMHMSIVISKYLLDCSTDTSVKGIEIKDEFNSYLLEQAVNGGDEND